MFSDERRSMTFAIGIVSFDRSPTENYIIPTLQSLQQDFKSPLLKNLTIYDSGSPKPHLNKIKPYIEGYGKVQLSTPEERLYIQENGARCLLESSKHESEWVMFIEDDIEVCSSFLKRVNNWLINNAKENVYAYTMCAAYPENLSAAASAGQEYWEYPVEAFYGIQCFVMKTKHARSFGEYLLEAPGGQYNDMHLKDWLVKQGQKVLYTPAPHSFVQHIGLISNYHKDRYHSFPFIGRG